MVTASCDHVDWLFVELSVCCDEQTAWSVIMSCCVGQTSVNMLQAATKSKGLDEDVLPFGRINRSNLDKAKDILLEIQ